MKILPPYHSTQFLLAISDFVLLNVDKTIHGELVLIDYLSVKFHWLKFTVNINSTFSNLISLRFLGAIYFSVHNA